MSNNNDLEFINEINNDFSEENIIIELKKCFDSVSIKLKSKDYITARLQSSKMRENTFVSDFTIKLDDKYFYMDFSTSFGLDFFKRELTNLYETVLIMNSKTQISFISINVDENSFIIRSSSYYDSLKSISLFIEKSQHDFISCIRKISNLAQKEKTKKEEI